MRASAAALEHLMGAVVWRAATGLSTPSELRLDKGRGSRYIIITNCEQRGVDMNWS